MSLVVFASTFRKSGEDADGQEVETEIHSATLAHELTQWTRHETRLNRELGRKRFCDEGNAMEELVAELGSGLLENGADVNRQTSNGKTALHFAVESGFEYLTIRLLYSNANASIADNNGNTPLHIAASIGNLETARRLIDNGALIDKQNRKGQTPLDVAGQTGAMDIIDLLVRKGAKREKHPKLSVNRGAETEAEFCRK